MEQLRCPFTSALNPATEAVHRHTRQWAESFGLVASAKVERQVATEQFTWLVGRFFPKAQLKELALISDFTSWLFWHDDVCDETTLGEDPPALARQFDWLAGILGRRNPIRAHDAFDLAMADLRDRFEEAAPSWGWFTRVLRSIREYFDAGVWEAHNRKQHLVPSLGQFIPMRRFAGGMFIYVDFVELANRVELPLPVRGHRDVVRLGQITANVACWHNDLFSLRKELAYGDVHNLVVVLAQERSLEIESATQAAIEICNKEVEMFEQIAGRLPSFGAQLDPLVEQYTESLGALMRGNLDWSLATQRYHRAFEPQTKAPHPEIADSAATLADG